jgi:pimeloyl-ACP methyl ester carboxylesterase
VIRRSTSSFGVVAAAVAVGLLLGPAVAAAAPKTAGQQGKKPSPTSPSPESSPSPSPDPTPSSTALPAAPLTTGVSPHVLPITRTGATLHLPYCSNAPAEVPNGAARTVVIVIHGDHRNACDYAAHAAEAADLSGELSSTLVLAPHFHADGDVDSADTTTLYWSSGGWKSGARSLRSPVSRPWAISSYEALDEMITAVADQSRFPGVTRVVVAGHSAGGQFVNRYTASTRTAALWTPDVTRRFVIANPSSYLYFDGRRPDDAGLRQLSADEVALCPAYDQYKYGLQNRYAFLAALDEIALKQQYSRSDVRYLLGERDTSTTSSSLDTGCEAALQGAHRLQRGQRYYDHLDDVLGAEVHERHQLRVVPGVGHDGRGMLTSTAGREALFR